MRLLVDGNLSGSQLRILLRKAGHDAILADEAGLISAPDPRVLTRAIDDARSVLTRDDEDFLDLHDLIVSAQGHHPGLLLVLSDDDRRREMSDRAIVTAIGRLEASGVPIADRVHILDHWR